MRRKRVVWVVLGAGALVAVGSVVRRVRAGRTDGGRVDAGGDTRLGAGAPAPGDDSLEVVEVESEGIDEDGNLVIDELLVAVDGAGDVVATDETVTVITPEGDAVVEETLSVMGEDGALHAVEEDITLLDADDD